MKEEGPKTPVDVGFEYGFDPSRVGARGPRRKPVPEAQGTVDLWPGGQPARHVPESGLEESIEFQTADLVSNVEDEWGEHSVVDIEDLPTQTVGFRHRTFRVLTEGRLELGDPVHRCHYELISVLGKGGMGLVCLARHRALGRDVALKLVRDSASIEKLEAFVREARITGMLQHPNVVPVYDLAMDSQGQVFYTMKRLSGASWEDLLSPWRILDPDVRRGLEERQASMTPDDHLEILEKVCEAVAYAHSKGLVHRDLKPSNVMIGDFGEVLVGDWGLAMEFGDDNPYVKDPQLEPKLAGTPAYMAPEMARGELSRLGPATDVYLLGGILYRLLVGEPPHSVDGQVATAIKKAASGDVTAPCELCPSLDPDLSDIAVKALAPRMEDRYQSALEFKSAIREYRSHAKSLKVGRSALGVLSRLVALLGGELNRDYDGAPEGFEAIETPLPALDRHFGMSGRPLGDAQAVRAYALIGECVGSFRQAIDLWDGNETARAGLERTLRLAFLFAMRQQDLAVASHYLEELETFRAQHGGTEQTGKVEGTGQEREEGSDEDAAWLSEMRQVLERRMKYQRERAAMARRLKVSAAVSAVVALSAMIVAVVLLFRQSALEEKKRSLAEANLKMSRQRLSDVGRHLALADRFRRTQMASAVSLRARLLEDSLAGVERSVARYAMEAEYLLLAAEDALGKPSKTPAGRPGFYLDRDFRSKRTRPRGMVRRAPYGRLVSMNHVTVHLSPWARKTKRRRKRALADAARLARLARIFSEEHRVREDVLWSVVGTESGAFLSFPGFSRFAKRRDYDPRKRPWYRAGLSALDVTWAPPHVDAGGFGVLLSCVSPIRRRGRIAGVVGVELSMARLQGVLLDKGFGEEQRGLLVTQDRRILVDTTYDTGLRAWKKRFRLRRIGDLDPVLAKYVEAALARRVSQTTAKALEKGPQARLAAYAPISRTGWTLIVVSKSGAHHPLIP